jgi:hypothetical protein
MKNKILLSISALLVVALFVFWYAENQKATLAEKSLLKEENKQEFNSDSSEGKVDANGLVTHRNEEYGFEFKYPSSIAPISFPRETSSGNPLTLVFYDSKVTSDSLAKNPPDKKPSAKVKFVIDLLTNDNEKSELSPRDFVKSRYYNELEPFFKETRAGEFEAIELIDQPEKGYMLIIKLSNKSFLELGNRDNLEILNQIKPTFKSIR